METLQKKFGKPSHMAQYLNAFSSGLITSIAIRGYLTRDIQLEIQYNGDASPEAKIQFEHKEGFSSQAAAEAHLAVYPYTIALATVNQWHGRGWVALWGYCRNKPRKRRQRSPALDTGRYRGCDKQIREQRQKAKEAEARRLAELEAHGATTAGDQGDDN